MSHFTLTMHLHCQINTCAVSLSILKDNLGLIRSSPRFQLALVPALCITAGDNGRHWFAIPVIDTVFLSQYDSNILR